MLQIIGQTAQEYKMAFFCLHRWHMWDLKREKKIGNPTHTHGHTAGQIYFAAVLVPLLSCVILLDMEPRSQKDILPRLIKHPGDTGRWHDLQGACCPSTEKPLEALLLNHLG